MNFLFSSDRFDSMVKQQEIITILKAFFRDDVKQIRAAALIGSFGRGQGSSSSDIDFELLIADESLDVDQFTKDVVHLFVNRGDDLVVKHTLWLAEQHKLALYHGEQLLLTEIYLYREFIIGKRFRLK
jgi:predicted nucleotidyltransferase